MRLGEAFAVVVVVAASACGQVTATHDAPGTGGSDSGPDLNEGARSGTRLKLSYTEFDGTRSSRGLFDAQRHEACYLTKWTDGTYRCVPTDSRSIVYTDATCSQKVGQVYRDPSCTTIAPPAYFLESSYAMCASAPAHLYQRSARVAVTQYYQRYSDGTCGGPFATTGNYYDFYSLGSEVAVSELATASVGAPEGAGRLTQRFWESPDGMRMPLGVHDALLGVDCSLDHTGTGATTAHCVPEGLSYTYYFRDAACAQSVTTTTSTCPAPKFAAKDAGCPYDPPTYFTVGAALTPTSIYYTSGPSCVMTAPSAGETYYALGTTVTLAEAARGPDHTGHRIEAIHAAADGVRIKDYTLFDTQKMTECYAYTGSDGVSRCMPAGGSAQTLYTTSTCTSPVEIMSVYRGAATCAPPPLPSYAIKAKLSTSCIYDYESRPVGAPHTAPLFTKYSDGTCHPYANPTALFYDVGAPVPLDGYAVGTDVIEP